MAAPSWRAATKVAPAATRALVTAKLPLPIRPDTCRTPSSASVAPTASATRMPPLPWDQGQGPGRASRPAGDGEGSHDQDGARRRQAAESDQRGQAVLAGAVHVAVAGEGRVEPARHPRVGAHRLDTEADDRRLLGQPAGALGGGAGGVGALLVHVEKGSLIAGAALPAGAEEEPSAVRQRTVVPLPGGQVLDLEEEVGVV